MLRCRAVLLLSLAVLVTGCATPSPSAPASSPNQAGTVSQASAPAAERVLTVSIAREPTFIAGLAPLPSQQASDFYVRMFNAFVDLVDDQNRPQPYLAEALPQLNTDTWTILPDGKMETRYHLKPNLVWHDGQPLVADDFVFAFEVSAPANGFRTAVAPYTMMESVLAPDPRTVVIRWKSIYPDAGLLLGAARFGLVPIPRRLVGEAYQQGMEAFQGHPYWSHEFVGAGPYKLAKWDLGTSIEAVAFDQHVTGRPKIDRIRMLFISEPNTSFANLLSGNTQMALDSITFAHMLQLKQEWAPTNGGTAGFTSPSTTTTIIQHRPEYANPRAILDPRVHKAFAHSMDRQTLAETIWAGQLQVLDTIFDPKADYYPEIERAITKYPYDLRASERLMNEAGYTKGPDGFFASPAEGKLTFALWVGQTRPELSVLGANWRQAGLDIQERGLSPVELIDPMLRSTSPSFYVTPFSSFEVQQLSLHRGSDITTAENRWRGENYSGWVNAEYDRLLDAYSVTLDRSERVRQRAQMAKLISEELPYIVLMDNPNPHAYLSSVKNVVPVQNQASGRITWNIEKWELQ